MDVVDDLQEHSVYLYLVMGAENAGALQIHTPMWGPKVTVSGQHVDPSSMRLSE